MNYRLGVCFIAPLILVFTLVAVGLGPLVGKNAAQQEAKTTSLIDSLGNNVHLAELLWVLCQQELMYANEVVEDIDFSFPEEKSSNKNYIFRRSNVDNSLLDCLRKKNLLFLLSEEDGVPINRFTLYLDVIYARPYSRRELIQSVGVSPALSPAAISPTPFPDTSRANPPSPPFFPDSTSQLTSNEESFSGVQSIKEKRTYKTVVNAVIVTAVVTFFVSALLFLSYRRLCSGPGQGRNDVKPLLSLSTSDHSVASSRKSSTLNSPSNRENPANEALDTKSIDNAKTGDFHLHSGLFGEWKINDPVGTGSEAKLKSVDNVEVAKLDSYGLLPLKPPPGRRISSIPTLGPGKTSLYSSAPPAPPTAFPPPPPVPPPPKSSFSGARPQAPTPPPIPFSSKTNTPVGVVTPPKSRPLPDIGSSNHEAEAPKAKLKPFFWDKVLTNPDHSMVWHQIKSGSFQFNEEMIETLFGYAPAGKTKGPLKESSSQDPPSSNYIQIIDRKKSQNLSILLKALNVTTEEVCDALQEGDELPSELIQSLLKMAPTNDEELKLRLYSGDLSRLGPAERFLKVLVDIPSAFKKLESLLFMCTLQEEEKFVKESFSILEAACMELRKSKLFLKLLEAVLKTGNRMNDGTYRGGAQAFKLDTLLKLSDVKGLDGKTTLLHFVVQEIVRSEGVRAAREKNPSMSSIDSDNPSEDTEDYYQSIGLQVVSGLGDELENVKRAAGLDLNTLTGTVSKLAQALVKARDILNSEMKNVDEENGFYQSLRSFVQNAEVDINWLLEEEKRIMALVKSTGDYFHGSSAKDEGLRIFVIVRDFLVILERVCRELENSPRKLTRCQKKHDTKAVHTETRQSLSPDTRERICTLIKNRRIEDDSSSDDDNL